MFAINLPTDYDIDGYDYVFDIKEGFVSKPQKFLTDYKRVVTTAHPELYDKLIYVDQIDEMCYPEIHKITTYHKTNTATKNPCENCSFYYCGACHNTYTSEWGNPCPMMK